MKANLYVEVGTKKVCEKNLTDAVKEIWRNDGGLMKDLKNVDLYYKVEENTCYYIINGKTKGSFVAEFE